MPIEVLRHFSVPIYSLLVPDFEARKGELVRALADIRNEGPGVAMTNRNAWHSELELHRRDDARLRWVVDNATALARGALGDYYGGFRDTEPRVVDMWAVIGGRGAWHTPHHHMPRAWSGVFYVAAEHVVSKSDPMDRAGKLEFLNPIAAAQTFFSPPSVAYAPRDGLMLLFPAALSHLVHPNTSDEERVIMSFNLDIVHAAR